MVNVIVIDKIQNTINVLSSYIKQINGVNLIQDFEDFNISDEILSKIDVVIFDVDFDTFDEVIGNVRKIKEKYPKIKFIATSYEINSQIVVKTLNQGIEDFLIKPLIFNIFEASMKKIFSQENEKINNVISVFSSKSGSGKTSLLVNLAFEIAKETNRKVCLLDFSFNNEDISTFLNIEPKFNFEYILNNIERFNEKELLSLINQYRYSNLYVFPSFENYLLSDNIKIKDIKKLITSLKSVFSYILIDTNSIIDEKNVSILNLSDLILFLGLENISSIRNCQKAYEVFDKIGYCNDKIKLIINRHLENCEITPQIIEQTLSKQIFYKIPNNYITLIDAINQGCLVGESNPNSNIAKAYNDMSKKIIELDIEDIKEKNQKSDVKEFFDLIKKIGE